MSVRVKSLRYLFALTAPDRKAIIPQPTVQSIAERIKRDVERRLKGRGQ